MTVGTAQLDLAMQAAAAAVPVAVYFLILGLLNSRPHPQLLRARRDFAILVGALCPLFVLPAVAWAGTSPAALAALAAAGAAAVAVLAPPRRSWVVYNVTAHQALRAVEEALRAAAIPHRRDGQTFRLDEGRAGLTLAPFPLLRNVSLRLQGDRGGDLAGRFERAMARRLETIPVETAPMTMALLLVATGMLAAPLALMAPRVPEIVRLIGGILP